MIIWDDSLSSPKKVLKKPYLYQLKCSCSILVLIFTGIVEVSRNSLTFSRVNEEAAYREPCFYPVFNWAPASTPLHFPVVRHRSRRKRHRKLLSEAVDYKIPLNWTIRPLGLKCVIRGNDWQLERTYCLIRGNEL